MEKSELLKKILALQTKEDLLQLLNLIVKDELRQEDAFTFSMAQLMYFCNPNNVRGRYTHFSIPKKSGSERQIAAPTPGLRDILYYINIILKTLYTPSDYAMGFVEGRNVVSNATLHVGKNYVFNTDLENFFPSIEQPRVWKRLQLAPFNFSRPIANIIAGLCCIREKQENGQYIYVLPQGAPTSPLLTNAICDSLDRKLAGLARRFGLHYSRYADDITFSSMHNVYQNNKDFITELKRIITGQNFHINEAKTRLQKRGERQEVTGLTVNSGINTSKKYKAEIRNLLHIWEKYGYKEAYKRFYPHYKRTKGHIKKGEPMLENVLYGKLQYLRMVKGAKHPVYLALQERYNKLTSPINGHSKESFDFLRAFSLSDFENITNSPIQLAISSTHNLYAYTMLEGKKILISLTNAVKEILIKKGDITNSTATSHEEIIKSYIPFNSTTQLYVVLTAKKGHTPFWLMTDYDPTITGLHFCSMPISQLIDIWETKGIDEAIATYEKNSIFTKVKNIESLSEKNESVFDKFSIKENSDDNIQFLHKLFEDGTQNNDTLFTL